MEKLNNVLPEAQEEAHAAAGYMETPLLVQVRQKFGVFGTVSLVFGGFLALLFYKTWIGLNVFLYTVVMIALISIIMKHLSRRIKTGTKFYFTGAFLLSVSSCLTSSAELLFFNILGILLLLLVTLLHQFHEDSRWDFPEYFRRMLGTVFYSVASIPLPFSDSINFLKHIKMFKNDKSRNVLIGFLAAIPVLLIITGLLSSADLLFRKMTNNIFSNIITADIFAFTIIIIIGFLVCYCILCGSAMQAGKERSVSAKKADASIAITFMSLLCLVYAIFCAIQILYLFSNGFLMLPQEFTFSEYARRGFFELLAVTIINIILMLLCNAFFKESRLLRILLTFMTICTYIMIASSAYRMFLYISVYHLTFLRLLVLLMLLIDAFILAGVIISQYNRKFPLFYYGIAVVTVSYLVFSFAKPDYYIAAYLIDHKETLELEDMRFLTRELSLDAAPCVLPAINNSALWSLTEEQQDGNFYKTGSNQELYGNNSTGYYIGSYYDQIEKAKKNTGFRDFNYSNYSAARAADRYPEY